MNLDRQARIDRQDEWDVWFQDQYWGRITLAGDAIEVAGPNNDAIHNLLISMRRDVDDTALFRSLPFRLNSHLYLASQPQALTDSIGTVVRVSVAENS